MSTKRWIGVALACLVFFGCQEPAKEIPLTTTSDEARQLYIKGRDALEVLRTDEARSYFEQAVAKDPEFAMAHLALAETATTDTAFHQALHAAVTNARAISEGERLIIMGVDAGRVRDAALELEHYRRAVRLYPEDARLQVRLGDYYLKRRNHKDSVDCYREATELDPEFSLPYHSMAQNYIALGQFSMAEKTMSRFIERNEAEPRVQEAYAYMKMRSGQFDGAKAAYERALELDPQATVARIGTARLLMLKGEGNAAREALRELEGEASTEAQQREAQIWRAASHFFDGQRDEALASLEEARTSAERSQDPEALADVLSLLGQVLLETGEPDLALARFTVALETIRQSDLERQQKQIAQRQFIFNEARVAIAKHDQAAAWRKASELRDTVQRKWAEGVEDLFNEMRGRISLSAGQHEMALQGLEHANQHDPRVLYLTALALQGVGRVEAARRLCQRVVDFNDPGFAWAFVRDDAVRLLDELGAVRTDETMRSRAG